MRLAVRAFLSLAAYTVAMALLLFVPAGTVRYWQGWVYLAIVVGAAFVTMLDLLARDPALLERRMVGGPMAEKRPAQKVIMVVASAAFIAMVVVPACVVVPAAVVVAAAAWLTNVIVDVSPAATSTTAARAPRSMLSRLLAGEQLIELTLTPALACSDTDTLPVGGDECDMQDLSVREDPGEAVIEDLAPRSHRTARREVGDGEVAVDEAPDSGRVDAHRRVEQS